MSGSGACRDQYDSWLDDLPAEYAEDVEKVNEHHEVGERGCGVVLHVTGGRLDDVEVWLNTTGGDFDGLAIGGGESRAQALRDAIETLERALKVLKGL